ncbi:MAG: hypothetical protein LBL79_08960 [Prevotella sp.]|jgi:hypothetical protein|nr:hypothetical protein [Prevotella sp.]
MKKFGVCLNLNDISTWQKKCNRIIINDMLPIQGVVPMMLSLPVALPRALIYQAFSLKIPGQ